MVKEKSTDELIKELLEKRGYESRNQIEKFINPDYSDFRNPFDSASPPHPLSSLVCSSPN